MKSLYLSSVYFLLFMLLPTLSLGCASSQTASSTTEIRLNSSLNYPDTWWAPVDPSTAASWEILPQDAGPGEVILSKRNELGILSNFAATPFTFQGKTYASIEGFWQAMKFPENAQDPRAQFPGIKWSFTRAQIEQMTGFDAKNASKEASNNMKKMGIDWVTFDGKQIPYRFQGEGEFYQLINKAMWEKLQQNPPVKELLLKTGDLILRADHKPEPNQPPAWNYFDIWMKFRKQLQVSP